MNAAEFHARATEEFGKRVAAIRDDQWTAPTPDTEWDVRALVNHLVSEQIWIAPLVTDGLTVPQVGNRFEGDLLGNDPRAAWESVAKEAVASFGAPGALTKTVHLSSRDVPGQRYAEEVACDLTIHAWDLAAAIGQHEQLEQDLLDECWRIGVPMLEEWRAAGFADGFYAAPPSVSQDADLQTRLLAFYGRARGWKP